MKRSMLIGKEILMLRLRAIVTIEEMEMDISEITSADEMEVGNETLLA